MLTRIQLVDYALTQAQLDTNFRTLGRTWLNHVLNKLYKRSNYLNSNILAAAVPLVAGVDIYALPTDFGRADACFFYNAQGIQGAEIPIVDSYMFDPWKQGSSTGAPSVAYIDVDTETIHFNSKPSQGSTDYYRLRYFKEAPSYSTDSSDDNVIPDFEDQDMLIQEVIAQAFEYTDDERQDKKKAEAMMSRKDFQRNMNQNDNQSVCELDRLIFRNHSWNRRRNNRSGF